MCTIHEPLRSLVFTRISNIRYQILPLLQFDNRSKLHSVRSARRTANPMKIKRQQSARAPTHTHVVHRSTVFTQKTGSQMFAVRCVCCPVRMWARAFARNSYNKYCSEKIPNVKYLLLQKKKHERNDRKYILWSTPNTINTQRSVYTCLPPYVRIRF